MEWIAFDPVYFLDQPDKANWLDISDQGGYSIAKWMIVD